MGKALGLLATILLGALAGSALEGRFTVRNVLANAVMIGAIVWPAFLSPRRYAAMAARCRVPWVRRNA
ncbi:MAG TPA: hypothetical protein VFU03_07490 [Gemmatimonadales bacterium]|nr:hypothetical protein [Gemmatimonadales bacterium]